tara:strand:- start:1627 stop:2157 length:531 start_codon:yes stop_codon:yes gene_type:complete
MTNTALDYYNAEINKRFTAEYVNAPATEYLAKALEAKQAFMREHLCSKTELWYDSIDETGYAPAFGTDSPFLYAANDEVWGFIRAHADGRDKQVAYSHHVQVPVPPAEQHASLCYFHATTFAWWHCWHVPGHAPVFSSKQHKSTAVRHVAYEQTTHWWPDGPEQYSTCYWLIPLEQ